MKGIHTFGIIMAIVLIIVGAVFPVPDKFVNVISYSYDENWFSDKGIEYVGGDAYNYQMEASLKAGWVSGVLALKAVAVSSGILLLMITLYADSKEKAINKQTEILTKIYEAKSIENNSDNTTATTEPKNMVDALPPL